MAIDFPNSPTVDDTFTVGGRTWKWNGTAWLVVPPAGGGGGVPSVVHAVFTDTFDFAAYSWTDVTDYVATITPSSATAKILVTVSMTAAGRYDSDAYARITRDGTAIAGALGPAAGSRPQASFGMAREPSNGSGTVSNHTFVYLDSPGTDVAVEYGVQAYGFGSVNKTNSDGDDAYHPRAVSTITLMEVVEA